MAFLTCYYSDSHADDWLSKAAYIGQGFYRQLFATCLSDPDSFGLLSSVASLGYGDEFRFGLDNMPSLLAELDLFAGSSPSVRVDVDAVRSACDSAVLRGCNLKIAGDMRPVLECSSTSRCSRTALRPAADHPNRYAVQHSRVPKH